MNSAIISQTPILGIIGYSGSGKTVLLCKLLQLCSGKGIRTAVIKHSHHDVDSAYSDKDNPDKDSHKLRGAGATQAMLVTKNGGTLLHGTKVHATKNHRTNNSLQSSLQHFDHDNLDIIFVEGFKFEKYPKIEVYRSGISEKLLAPSDPNIIAIAANEILSPFA